MKKKVSAVIKCSIFCLLAVLMIVRFNSVLTIKGKEYGAYYNYAQFGKFYDMKKDSVDVLFIGSSHSYCGFSPQEFYDRYGIRSYNLGSSSQSMWLSYYWLKEALKTQSPKIVVLEVFYIREENGNEASVQKALSYMKWSRNKADAVRVAVSQFPELSFKSFLLPNIRFHDRWSKLKEEDYLLPELRRTGALKGYAPTFERIGESEKYTVIRGDSAQEGSGIVFRPESSQQRQCPAISMEYLDKITALCKEKGITLILAKNPSSRWDIEEYNAIKAYAESNGLPYYDLNVAKYYTAMDYDFGSDNRDGGHANIWGAEKIADLMGEILVNEYGAAAVKDEQWEEAAAYTEKIKKEFALKYIDNAQEYLKALAEGDYDILISVKGDAAGPGEDLKQAIKDLGLSEDPENSYAAVIDKESSVKQEDTGKTESSVQGTLHNGLAGYKVISCRDEDRGSSIMIGGKEYSLNKKGINIVVYSKELNDVLDCVCLAAENNYELER